MNSKYKKLSQEVESMNLGVTAAFSQIKEELTEHLDSINQNTGEFEAVAQRMDQLETMIEKLAERIDTLSAESTPQEQPKLSLREQEFFVALYTATEVYAATEYARYLSLTEELVHALAHKLISKSVPVMKSTDELGRICYALDQDFKHLQAKQNLIPIDSTLLEQLREKDIDF